MKIFLLTCFLVLLLQYVMSDVAMSSGECELFNATNTQGAMQNYIICEIEAKPGDVLHINTCNASTLNGDTYLRLFDPTDSVELVEADDGCDEDVGGTAVTYVVPIGYQNDTVTLHLHQGCFSTHSCSAVTVYTLNMEASPLPFPTTSPADDDRYFDHGDCPVTACLDTNHPAKGWNRCHMCICDSFDKIFLSDYDHDCHADETYYMCMVKYDVKSISCTTQMKPGWIAAFFFIGLCGFLIFAGAFGYIIYILCFQRPNKPIQPILVEVKEVKQHANDHSSDEVDKPPLL